MRLARPTWRQFEELTQLADDELMKCLAEGCSDAVTVLFDRYHRLVYGIALRIVRDPGEAEEVVQTVFLDVFRAVASFDSRKGIFKTWLVGLTYHRALHRKRHLVSNHFYRWEALEGALDAGTKRSLTGGRPEMARLAEELLGKLKPRQRTVLELTYYEGLTAEEAAERLGETVNVVRHDLHRGLAALRLAAGKAS